MDEDFEKVIKYNEIIQEIISTAQNLNDPCDFGVNVAGILKDNKLIDEAIFEVIIGQ